VQTRRIGTVTLPPLEIVLKFRSNMTLLGLTFTYKTKGSVESAGPKFEPGLTDPESVSLYTRLFAAVQKTAF